MSPRSFSLAVVCALLAVVPAWAHHSHGNYNTAQATNLTGKVTEVQWINPHSWIYLEVTGANGQAETWALEGASFVQLNRKGWTKDMIKAGDTVAVRCYQLRDGTNGCLLGFISIGGAPEKEFD
jgi:hypothetical protein